MSKKANKAAPERLKRRSVIRINTDQALKVELTFVPGERPYIHFSAEETRDYVYLSGFIDDKDVPKLKRFVDACTPLPQRGRQG